MQLSIFDVIDENYVEVEIEKLLKRSMVTVEGKLVDKSKIVSVYIPEQPSGAEPAVITLENNNYIHYDFVHGHLYETKESSPFFNRFPPYYWTWLDRDHAAICY